VARTRSETNAESPSSAPGGRVGTLVWAATMVATVALSGVVAVRPAGADQIASLKGEAKAIAQKLVQVQLSVDADRQSYAVAVAAVNSDARAMAGVAQQIAQDAQQVDKEVLDVRRQAVSSYMEAGGEASSAETVLFTGNAERSQLASEYAAIASGNIETSLDALALTRRALQGQQALLAKEQLRDQADVARQGASLSSADTAARQLEALQGQVTGQLAAAVAAQEATQAAAATAALAAARRPSTTASASAATSSPVSDPSLNPFLQCVVEVESGGNYQAVSPDGQFMGAFQFSQSTWNSAAPAAGLADLVGVAPNDASKAEQDAVAVALYALDGDRPWLGDRCSP